MLNLTPSDLNLLSQKGISIEQLEEQLSRHASGFPFLEIKNAATPGNGIHVLTPEQEKDAEDRWQRFLADGGEVCKFVPASGAASRMFKALYEFADGDLMKAPEGSAPRKLIDHLSELPFLSELREAVERNYGTTPEQLAAEGRDRDLISAIILPDGMNYGNLPKGLLQFHKYADGSRTPLEEHLTEGAQTAAQADGRVQLHFTVSSNHRKLFEEKLAKAVPMAEARTGKRFTVSLSEQRPSTDTVAANPDGTPFREGDDNHLLFRPGGHGALISNLADIDAAVVFIKNIDNVVPDSRRESTVRYKAILGGYLMEMSDRIVSLVKGLHGDNPAQAAEDAVKFMRDTLCITDARIDELKGQELYAYIENRLRRPLRVCGMVRNEGEPGGGPFIARDADGAFTPQILESHQIDMSRPEYAAMLNGATHFNPVDLVCLLRDPVSGERFDLSRYVDPSTGFISSKSSHGRELRALELPGLWNGAMAGWNTAFVEVPASTFNPVKTVLDLLRPAHQG